LVDGSSSTIANSALNTALAEGLREALERALGRGAEQNLPLEIRPQILFNPAMRSPNFFVPGVIGVVLQIATTFATAMALVRERERGTLEQLLVKADIVTLHVPLSSDTRHLIGRRELRLMKGSAFLINTSRGPIIDQAALVEALHAGTIGGAGLDVAEVEPIPADDPLLSAPNCVLLPHIGSATLATRSRMASMAVDNCLAGLRGEPLPNQVNGPKGS
jgi:hypothetical protein